MFSILKKQTSHVIKFPLFAALLLSALPIKAQVDAGALQRNYQRQLTEPNSQLPKVSVPDAKPSETVKDKGPRFTVRQFILEGVKAIPEEKVQEVLKPWLDQSVDFDELQNACDAIMELYRKNGLNAQALLPPQKISQGQVRILITEAKLGSVIINQPEGPTRFSPEEAKKYITHNNPIGELLNNDKLQHALILLRETPGLVVRSSLEPGDNDGEVSVKMDLSDDRLATERLEINNYGSRLTGANQAVAGLQLSDPLGIGDQAGVSVISSVGSQFGQVTYLAPIGYDGFKAGVNATYLNYTNVSNYKYPNGGYGNAWTASPNVTYPLIRSEQTNVSVNAGYFLSYYTNYNIVGNTVSSAYNTNSATFGLSANHADSFAGGGSSSLYLIAESGNVSISPTSPSNYGVYIPNNYNKLNFTLSRSQQLTEDGLNAATLVVNGQFASANLVSSELFYLGGPQAVRAYPVAQSGGAQGGVASLDINHKLWDNYTISAFYDYGLVQQYRTSAAYTALKGLTNANNTYSLSGTGLSLKWNSGGWALVGTVAWALGKNPLYNSSGQAVNVDSTTTKPLGWFSAAYNF